MVAISEQGLFDNLRQSHGFCLPLPAQTNGNKLFSFSSAVVLIITIFFCTSELDHNMDRRTHESPMDFEWQTQPPADVTSPFYQLSQRHGQRRE